MENVIKIFIADDHKLIREGFKKIFSRERDMLVIGEAGNGAEVLHFLKNDRCDVIVLDISMPGKSGWELLHELKNFQDPPPVLVLSIHPENQFAVRALKAGAYGYISKECPPEQLVEAVRKVASGRRYVSRNLSEEIVDRIACGRGDIPHERLSDREFQIFLLIASGKSISVIAEILHLSASTVNTYRSRILEKMNLASNAEIIRYALKNGLIE